MPTKSLIFCFEEIRLPTHFWHLLLPEVQFTRGILAPLAIVFVVTKAWHQLVLVAMVESFTLAFELMASPRHSWPEQMAEVSLHVFTLVYLILKGVSMSPLLADDVRQKQVGMAMGIALICLMGVGGIFAIITIGYMIVGGVKTLIAKCRAFKKSRKVINSRGDEYDNKAGDSSQLEPLEAVSNKCGIFNKRVANPMSEIDDKRDHLDKNYKKVLEHGSS